MNAMSENQTVDRIKEITEKLWIREDGYHDEFPYAVYNSHGFIVNRFSTEKDAIVWIAKKVCQLQTTSCPGIRKDL
jgi:hypothetical protein